MHPSVHPKIACSCNVYSWKYWILIHPKFNELSIDAITLIYLYINHIICLLGQILLISIRQVFWSEVVQKYLVVQPSYPNISKRSSCIPNITLWYSNSSLLKMAIEIVSCPWKMAKFHSYVNVLAGGKSIISI